MHAGHEIVDSIQYRPSGSTGSTGTCLDTSSSQSSGLDLHHCNEHRTDVADVLAVNIGAEMLKVVPGRVSTEVRGKPSGSPVMRMMIAGLMIAGPDSRMVHGCGIKVLVVPPAPPCMPSLAVAFN